MIGREGIEDEPPLTDDRRSDRSDRREEGRMGGGSIRLELARGDGMPGREGRTEVAEDVALLERTLFRRPLESVDRGGEGGGGGAGVGEFSASETRTQSPAPGVPGVTGLRPIDPSPASALIRGFAPTFSTSDRDDCLDDGRLSEARLLSGAAILRLVEETVGSRWVWMRDWSVRTRSPRSLTIRTPRDLGSVLAVALDASVRGARGCRWRTTTGDKGEATDGRANAAEQLRFLPVLDRGKAEGELGARREGELEGPALSLANAGEDVDRGIGEDGNLEAFEGPARGGRGTLSNRSGDDWG